MAIQLNTVVVNGVTYEYNAAQIESELLVRGLTEAEVAQALTEIENGDFGILWLYGMEDLIGSPSGAELPPPPKVEYDFSGILDKFEGLNLLEVLYALNQAAQEIRKAGREMRHAERDLAVDEAMRSADKIRSSAMINMIVGVISGAVNIGMGVFSVVSSAKQLSSIKNSSVDLKMAKQDVGQVKADAKLADSQVKLSQAKTEAAAKQANFDKVKSQVEATDNVKAAENKLTQLQAEKTAMQEKALKSGENLKPSEVAAKDLEIKAAENDLAAKQKQLDALGGPKTLDDLKTAQTELDAANAKVKTLEADVLENAEAAGKINSDRLKTAESELARQQKEIEGLKGDRTKAEAEVKAAKAEVETLTANKASQADIDKATARLNRANENFADVDAQIKTAEQRIPMLETRVNEAKAQAAVYEKPLSDDALKGAQGRLESSTAKLKEATVNQRSAQSEFDRAVAVSNAQSARVTGLNTAAGGLTQALQGIGGFAAADEQADGAEHTARSQVATSREGESADFQKAAEDLMSKVKDIMKEMFQAYNQANASIYRNM